MRRASKPDLSSRECKQQQGAHSVAAARMQNNKDAGQQDDDKLQPAMTAVEDAGERLRLHSAGRFKAPTERYNITSRGHGAGEGSGRQRSGEGRSPSICWYWERTGTCQRGTGCLWLNTSLPPSA
jgi:hypothetical protein